jgi:hypothetical protein
VLLSTARVHLGVRITATRWKSWNARELDAREDRKPGNSCMGCGEASGTLAPTGEEANNMIDWERLETKSYQGNNSISLSQYSALH